MHMHKPKRTALALAWLVSGMTMVDESLAQTPWHYTIGQEVLDQQSNFCTDVSVIDEIARIFEQQDPRAGYSALKHHAGCSTVVQSFTPQKIIRRVRISKDQPGEYAVTFVEVITSRGKTEYLVTTRNVLGQL